MQYQERVRLLERALLSYVAKHGFTAEAEEYFVSHYQDCTRIGLPDAEDRIKLS
jgi:hypothetical protein